MNPTTDPKGEELVKTDEPKEGLLIHQEYQEIQSSYSGPIPSPAHLEHYERVLHGSADRIIKMAELEQGHRIAQDNKNANLNLIGLWIGAFLVLALLGVAVYSIYAGATTVAGIILSAIVGIAVIFVLRQRPYNS